MQAHVTDRVTEVASFSRLWCNFAKITITIFSRRFPREGRVKMEGRKSKQVGYFKSPVGVYEIRADNDGVTSLQLKGTKTDAVEENKKLDHESRSTRV